MASPIVSHPTPPAESDSIVSPKLIATLRRARYRLRLLLDDPRLHDAQASSGVVFPRDASRPSLAVWTTPQWLSRLRAAVPEQLEGLEVRILTDPGAVTEASRSLLSHAIPGRFQPRPGNAIRVAGNSNLGTLGCFVTREGRQFALTCQHCICDNSHQPMLRKHAETTKRRRGHEPKYAGAAWSPLGRVHEVGGINIQAGTADIDSALIEVGTTMWCPKPDWRHKFTGTPVEPFEAIALRLKVQKWGCSTGKSYGRVKALRDIRIRYTRDHTTYTVAFRDVFEIESEDYRVEFCEYGDSGSLVVEAGPTRVRPLGLLCSTGLFMTGFAIPIERVFRHHGVQLVGAS